MMSERGLGMLCDFREMNFPESEADTSFLRLCLVLLPFKAS